MASWLLWYGLYLFWYWYGPYEYLRTCPLLLQFLSRYCGVLGLSKYWYGVQLYWPVGRYGQGLYGGHIVTGYLSEMESTIISYLHIYSFRLISNCFSLLKIWPGFPTPQSHGMGMGGMVPFCSSFLALPLNPKQLTFF